MTNTRWDGCSDFVRGDLSPREGENGAPPAFAQILTPGETCWKASSASRAALLVDGEIFMRAMLQAMEKARRSILLIGWDFDPHVSLAPTTEHAENLSEFLQRLLDRTLGLSVHILIWDMASIFAMQRRNAPRDAPLLLPSGVVYRVDDQHPPGASHHQKLLVIDDQVTFCGGADKMPGRCSGITATFVASIG